MNTPKSLSRSGSIRFSLITKQTPPSTPTSEKAEKRRSGLFNRSYSSKETSSSREEKDSHPGLFRRVSLKNIPKKSPTGHGGESPAVSPSAQPTRTWRLAKNSSTAKDVKELRERYKESKSQLKETKKDLKDFKRSSKEIKASKKDRKDSKSLSDIPNLTMTPTTPMTSVGETDELPDLPPFCRVSEDTRGSGRRSSSSPNSGASNDSATILPRGSGDDTMMLVPSTTNLNVPIDVPLNGPGNLRASRQNSDPGNAGSSLSRLLNTFYTPPKETRSGRKQSIIRTSTVSTPSQSSGTTPDGSRVTADNKPLIASSTPEDPAKKRRMGSPRIFGGRTTGESSTSVSQQGSPATTSKNPQQQPVKTNSSSKKKANRSSGPFVSLDLSRVEGEEFKRRAANPSEHQTADSSRTMDSGRILPQPGHAEFFKDDVQDPDEQEVGLIEVLEAATTPTAYLYSEDEPSVESPEPTPRLTRLSKGDKTMPPPESILRRSYSSKPDLGSLRTKAHIEFEDEKKVTSSSKHGKKKRSSRPSGEVKTDEVPRRRPATLDETTVPQITPPSTDELSHRIASPIPVVPVPGQVTDSEVSREIRAINQEITDALTSTTPRKKRNGSKKSSRAGSKVNSAENTPAPVRKSGKKTAEEAITEASGEASPRKRRSSKKKSHNSAQAEDDGLAELSIRKGSTGTFQPPQPRKSRSDTVVPKSSPRTADAVRRGVSDPSGITPRPRTELERVLHAIRGASGYLTPSMSIYHEEGVVVGMSLPTLIDTIFELNAPLCHHLADPSIAQAFWRTYYILLSSTDLLQELLQRLTAYTEESLIDHRHMRRVDEIVCCWIRFYYHEEDDEHFRRLLGRLDTFLAPALRGSKRTTTLVQVYNKRVRAVKPFGPERKPTFILNLISAFEKINLNPKAFALQLTAYLHTQFLALRVPEFFHVDMKAIPAPNLAHLINYQMALANFVQITVLYGITRTARLGSLRFFIDVATELRERNDFYSLNAILCGINAGPIRHLHSLWTKDSKLDEQVDRAQAGFFPISKWYRDRIQHFLANNIFFVPDLSVIQRDVALTLEHLPAFLQSADIGHRSSRLPPLVNIDRLRTLERILVVPRGAQKFKLGEWVRIDPDTERFLYLLNDYTPDDESQKDAYYARAEELEGKFTK